MDIRKLLKPRRICVVGASEKEGFGGDTARNVLQYMEPGTYYFVNPKRSTVLGAPAYPSIAETPGAFDLAVICTPVDTVEKLLGEAKEKGAGAAVVYASGYREMGTPEGNAAQESLAARCKELDMALMGPNCGGFVNYVDAVHAFAFIPQKRDRRGSVGFVSQSGQLAYSTMESQAISFSYAISAGNAAVTKIEDYVEFLVDDADTKVVAVYLEGIQEPGRFAASLRRAAELRKPVVILKTGRSVKGTRVASSHTGSMAGSDKMFDALFKKFSVIRVDDLEELIYTAQLFANLPVLPKGRGVASMNLSGGETGICADAGSLSGIEFPDFSGETLKQLRAMLPPYASPANPLDMTATLSYDTEKYAAALRTIMADPGIDLVLIGYTLTQEITDPAIRYMAEAMEKVGKESSKPIVMMPFAGNTRNQEYQKRLEQCGVTILPPPLYAFRILKALLDFAAYDYRKVDPSLAIPEKPLQGERYSLSEKDSKAEIARFGVPVPQSFLARDQEEAFRLASQAGFPLALKICSPDILHKTDIGGVALNINTPEEAGEAYLAVMANARKNCPRAHIEGALLERMLDKGAEFIIGVKNDEQLGPAVLAGLGGVYVEIFKDSALALAPISIHEARDMIESLTSARLLKGYRGSPPLDTAALAEALVNVSKMAAAMKDSLVEMDVNPLFVCEKGVCAADGVIVRVKD